MYGYNAEPPIAIPIYTVLLYCAIRLILSYVVFVIMLNEHIRNNNYNQCGFTKQSFLAGL